MCRFVNIKVNLKFLYRIDLLLTGERKSSEAENSLMSFCFM